MQRRKKGSLLVIILSGKYGAEIKHRTTESDSTLVRYSVRDNLAFLEG